jgi:uncharacterized protein YegL
MTEDLMRIRIEDLVSNPSTRLPVCLCLDISGSMNRTEGGTRTGRQEFIDGQMWDIVEGGTTAIQELEKGITYFFEALKDDEVARYSVELAVVVFQDNATVLLDFANIDRQIVPTLVAEGNTSIGEGVTLALDILEQRKREYSEKGVDYFQPWMVLMTDGYPTDDPSSAIERVKHLSKNKKLTLFPVAVGHDADIEILKQFSTINNNIVLKVTSAEYFKEFFEWLSQSVTVASSSIPGDKPTLPKTPPEIEIEL